ncbi:hypothetical protein N7475_003183 [Penicillium sp. IBT 31633x]|nr:hypothetical protein N7475_003183 [Penicillium sp. IBT 31633x]
MPRARCMDMRTGMPANARNLHKIWEPLFLGAENEGNLQIREATLAVIRQVYDPMLIEWLADPTHTWVNQFIRNSNTAEFQRRIIARIADFPSSVQSAETNTVLGGILFDLLRFYRFTDPSWRVPLPPAAPAPTLTPPTLPVRPASAPAALPVPLPVDPLDILTAAAEQVLGSPRINPLDILAVAAQQVLGSPAEAEELAAPAAATFTPLEILAEVAAAAAPLPTPAAPAAAEEEEEGRKREREEDDDDESERPAQKRAR